MQSTRRQKYIFTRNSATTDERLSTGLRMRLMLIRIINPNDLVKTTTRDICERTDEYPIPLVFW